MSAAPEACPLSVGIVTRDRREVVVDTVRSVLPQLGPDDELVVVDNGSRDGTYEAVAEVLDGRSPRCRVVVEPGGGVSAARNRALAEARMPIVCFLDDDIRPWPGWLAALRTAWSEAAPEVAVLGGPIVPDFQVPRPAWLADHQLYLVAALDLGDTRHRLDQAAGTGHVWGGNMSVRVAAAREVGGFDQEWGPRPDDPGDVGEEEELQRRLARHGFEVWYEPTAGVRHLLPAARVAADRLRHKVRDRARSQARRGASRRSGAAVFVRASARCVLALLRGRPATAAEASFAVVYGWTLAVAPRHRSPA